MEAYFITMLEDVRHERSLMLFLSPKQERVLRPAGFTDHELKYITNLSLEIIHRQKKQKNMS